MIDIHIRQFIAAARTYFFGNVAAAPRLAPIATCPRS